MSKLFHVLVGLIFCLSIDKMIFCKTEKNLTQNEQLQLEASQGNLEKVKKLINEGADPKTKDQKGKNSLHAAAYFGHLNIVKYLVEEKKMNLKEKDDGGNDVLLSVLGGRVHKDEAVPLVEYILENETFNEAELLDAFSLSLYYGYIDLVQHFVEDYKISFDEKMDDGHTPLHIAAYGTRLEVVKYLISLGADPCKKDNADKLPRDLTTDTRTQEFLKVAELLFNSKKLGDDGKKLFLAALSGDLTIVKKYENKINVKAENDFTVLHAAAYGDVDVVKYLIEEKNMEVNAVDGLKETALHKAVRVDNLPIAAYLLEKGANVNLENKENKIPLEVHRHSGLSVRNYLLWNAYKSDNAEIEESFGEDGTKYIAVKVHNKLYTEDIFKDPDEDAPRLFKSLKKEPVKKYKFSKKAGVKKTGIAQKLSLALKQLKEKLIELASGLSPA